MLTSLPGHHCLGKLNLLSHSGLNFIFFDKKSCFNVKRFQNFHLRDFVLVISLQSMREIRAMPSGQRISLQNLFIQATIEHRFQLSYDASQNFQVYGQVVL